MLKTNELNKLVGDARVLMLTNCDELISFCTLASYDAVYISTNHDGLHGKHGYEINTKEKDVEGNDTKVYKAPQKQKMIIIRAIQEGDRATLLNMMRVFYSSDAVATNGSEEIFEADITACISDDPYLEGYVIENDGEIIGYTMLAKSFSTEYGRQCIWIEDIYIVDSYRGKGLGSMLLKYVESKYPTSLLRLEVEEENERAIKTYKSCGFDFMPYLEMKK